MCVNYKLKRCMQCFMHIIFGKNLNIPDRNDYCKKGVKLMARNTKRTSRRVSTKASKILRDRRYSKISKSVAGSALSQSKPKK